MKQQTTNNLGWENEAWSFVLELGQGYKKVFLGVQNQRTFFKPYSSGPNIKVLDFLIEKDIIKKVALNDTSFELTEKGENLFSKFINEPKAKELFVKLKRP